MQIQQKINSVTAAKFILILGVVLIHCNRLHEIPAGFENRYISESGIWAEQFLSSYICNSICVPCFFIISGFLYFFGVDRFDVSTYVAKSRRRIRSLLVPYLVWNVMRMIIFLMLVRFLDYPSYGVVVDGRIDVVALLRGFWDLTQGWPYAYAFWYIRNLIVFVVFAPLAWVIGRNLWVLAGFFVTLWVTDFSLSGFEWFVLGGAMAVRKMDIFRWPDWSVCLGLACWVGIALYNTTRFELPMIVNFVRVTGAFVVVMTAARKFAAMDMPRIVGLMVSSTFYIYAVHQFYVTLVGNFYCHLFGLESFPQVMAAYLSTYVTLLASSFMVWLVLKSYFPRVTAFLAGGRV